MTIPATAPRQLIWVPVIHTQADLGSMSDSVRRLHMRKRGRAQWDRHIRTVEDTWGRIREDLERLRLDYARVRLYQDGLPTSPCKAEIVRDLAQAGSQNHRLLLDLMSQGAMLTGTEAPELLLEEYDLARQVLASLGSGQGTRADRRQQELSQILLERRDRAIAERINQTLKPGETGLIFLGMMHSLERSLAPDISVSRLGPARPGKEQLGLAPGGLRDQDKIAPPSGADRG